MELNNGSLSDRLIRLSDLLKCDVYDTWFFYKHVRSAVPGVTIDQVIQTVEAYFPYNCSTEMLIAKFREMQMRPQSASSNVYQPPAEQSNSKIEWNSLSTSRNSKKNIESAIDWETNLQSLKDYSFLIGAEDAFEHTQLMQGEKVAFCTFDKVAYHLFTWKFLQDQNGKRCCICGKTGTIQIVQLPEIQEIHISPHSASDQNLCLEKVIKLTDVHQHIGLAVDVQDLVQEVYETRNTGAFYIRFEKRRPTDPPFQGFKVVIRPGYVKEWKKGDLSPFNYEGQLVRVRGVIQNDPEWGIEILINSPRVIQVVNNP